MTDMRFEAKFTATAEVRDKDGNLKSSEPIEMTRIVSEDELRALLEGESK